MRLITAKELAEKMSISSAMVRVMATRKEIPHIRIGSEYRFEEEVIEEWIRGKILADSGFNPVPKKRRGRPPKEKAGK